ncbi:MAG: deiodinase-like protein [Pseudomonadota bacterium]
MGVATRMLSLFLLANLASGCSLLFPTEAGESLSHYDSTAPAAFEPAPDFKLSDLDGNPVELADLVGKRPVVLQLGSLSCPVFRYRRFDVQKLQRDFAGEVDFVVVYTQEAHPADDHNPYTDEVWNPFINKVAGINVPLHRTLDQRRDQAARAYEHVELDSLFLVDSMDNVVWQRYGAAPSPAYVLDVDGNIVLRQAWVNPKDIRVVLEGLLNE